MTFSCFCSQFSPKAHFRIVAEDTLKHLLLYFSDMIHTKSQALFSRKKVSSAAVVIGALRALITINITGQFCIGLRVFCSVLLNRDPVWSAANTWTNT